MSRDLQTIRTRDGTLGYDAAAHPAGEAADAVRDAISALTELDQATARVLGEAALSEFGRAQNLAPLRKKTIAGIGRSWEKLMAFAGGLRDWEKKLLFIDPADAVGQIQDMMVLERFHSRDANERAKLLEMMKRGDPQTHRIALALVRSPLRDTPLEQLEPGIAMNVWTASRRAAAADEFAKLDQAQDSVMWASPVIRQAASIAGKLLERPSSAAIPASTIPHMLLDAGVESGHGAWGIEDRAMDSFVRGQRGENYEARWGKQPASQQLQSASQEAA